MCAGGHDAYTTCYERGAARRRDSAASSRSKRHVVHKRGRFPAVFGCFVLGGFLSFLLLCSCFALYVASFWVVLARWFLLCCTGTSLPFERFERKNLKGSKEGASWRIPFAQWLVILERRRGMTHTRMGWRALLGRREARVCIWHRFMGLWQGSNISYRLQGRRCWSKLRRCV